MKNEANRHNLYFQNPTPIVISASNQVKINSREDRRDSPLSTLLIPLLTAMKYVSPSGDERKIHHPKSDKLVALVK